jgi:hypothetical protein
MLVFQRNDVVGGFDFLLETPPEAHRQFKDGSLKNSGQFFARKSHKTENTTIPQVNYKQDNRRLKMLPLWLATDLIRCS